MKCPVCVETTLLMSDKNGVEIDYCPNCRGIWLDRWEMEKLIQGEKRYMDSQYGDQGSMRHSDGWYGQHPNYYGSQQRHQKKSFLESFDFFD